MGTCLGCGHALGPGENPCSACGAQAVAPVEPVVAPGTTLMDGKWAIERELGQGGMGTVLLARDVELERHVAIKMLSPALRQQPDVITRFEREAKMLARLEHPNIVPIYAVGRHDGLPFIVMKNLEGTTLTTYLAERGRLTPDEMLVMARQLCAGLGFLHTKGIIHRDIKPGNIFVGPDGHVTILDLGVAHDAKQQMTRTGLLIGTPRYMSPEQILKGTGNLDHRSDIYALGTVLFEMLTGAPVFDAESDFSVMRAHTDQAPPDLASFAPDTPPQLTAVIHHALAKDRDARIQTAKELYDALEAAVQGRPIPLMLRVASEPASAAPAPNTAPRNRSNPPVDPAEPVLDPTFTPAIGRSVAALNPVPSAPDANPSAPPLNPSIVAAAGIRPRRSAAGWAIGAVVAAAAIAVVAFVSFKGEAPAPAADAVAPTASAPAAAAPPPAVAPPAVVREDPPPSPAPAVAAATEDPADEPEAKSQTKTPARAVDSARDRSRRSTRSQQADGASARQTSSGPTEVRVMTTFAGKASWAWLDINGLRRGTTPAILKLSPGNYTVRLTRPGYKTIEQSLDVRPGKPVRLALELQQ